MRHPYIKMFSGRNLFNELKRDTETDLVIDIFSEQSLLRKGKKRDVQ